MSKFKENDDYFGMRIEEAYQYAGTDLFIEKQIALNQEILLERRNTLDFRFDAAEHLSMLVQEKPKLVVPILLTFLESEEAKLDNPNKIIEGYRLMTDPNSYQNDESARKEFAKLKKEVLYGIDPELPGTKEAVPILIDIVIKECFEEYINAALYTLLRLAELHQDIRYIVYTKLQRVSEYNSSARLLIDYLDAFFNQLDNFDEDFNDYFFDKIYFGENCNSIF